MTTPVSFRTYCNADKEACLAIFDQNCPSFFAPNERADYSSFLDDAPASYEVCDLSGKVVAAFGLIADDNQKIALNWIMLDPASQGVGLGSAIMEHVISQGRGSQLSLINIAASHKSAPFFAKFGATEMLHTEDGWGPGMHRVDMELYL